MTPISLEEIKIVIIDNPYDCMADSSARDLWAKIMALKIAGYRSEYPYGVLPVDTSDFYSTHMALFVQHENEGLKPILVCKNISLERHELFSAEEFMLVDHFKKANAPAHLQAIRDTVEVAKKSGKNLHYFGSYTTDPEIRGDKVFSILLKELFLALHVNFHIAYGVEISACAGAKKFKVDKMLEVWGYGKLKLRGEELPDYRPACIFGGDATFFQTERFSDYAYSIAHKYKALWDARLHFANPPLAEKRAA